MPPVLWLAFPLLRRFGRGDQPADCLFGRLPTGLSSTLTASLPSAQRPGALAKASDAKSMESSYGLFAPNRTLIPGTLLAHDEAVKTAVNRLMPHLQTPPGHEAGAPDPKPVVVLVSGIGGVRDHPA